MAQAKQRGAYHAEWREIATEIKKDAGWKCVRCGQAHGPAADGQCLTVHHFDGDKDNNARWNLIALCQRCHLSVQARVNPESPLLMEPSEWARPYIAGYYEAGHGIPGPTYDLEAWIDKYQDSGRTWPEWAPRPQETPA